MGVELNRICRYLQVRFFSLFSSQLLLISFPNRFNKEKFEFLLKSAGRKFQKCLELDLKFLDDTIRDALQHQTHDLANLLNLSLHCSLLTVRLGELSKNLSTLDFGDCYAISDDQVVQIAKLVPGLESINLSNCYLITDDTLTGFSKHSPHLRTLDLSRTQITDEGVRVLSENCTKVTHLKFVQCPNLSDSCGLHIAQHLKQISSLDFERCKVGNQAAIFLAAYHTYSLNHLSFVRCGKLEDGGVINFTDNCNKIQHFSSFLMDVLDPSTASLRFLDLTGCSMLTDKALTAIACKITTLTDLSLESCYHITDKSMEVLMM